MPPTTILFTVILWLLSPNGDMKPASHATLVCEGILGWGGSNDDTPSPLLEADSRGGVIIEGWRGEYDCHASKNEWSWQGTFTVERDHARVNIDLTLPH